MSRSEGIERPARTSPRARRNPRRVLYSPEVPPVIAPTGSKRAGRSPRSEVRRNEETPSRRGLKIVGEPGRNPGFTDDLKSTAARKNAVPPESTTAPRGRPGRIDPDSRAHFAGLPRSALRADGAGSEGKRPSEEGRTFSLRISEVPRPSKNSGPGRSSCTIRRVPGL